MFEVSYIPYNYPTSPALRVLYQPVNDILDFLVYLGLLYLFYWQSMRATVMKKQNEVEAITEIA